MNTVQYKCPNCGGELVFNPEKQMFSCPYCASDFTEAEMEERYHTQNETAQKEAEADAKTLNVENDEDKKALLDYIRAGIDVDFSQILLTSLWLYQQREENIQDN